MTTLPTGPNPVKTEGAAVDERTDEAVVVTEYAHPCATCRAWVPIKAQHAEVGRCHRHPPQTVHGQETDTLEGYTDSVWPETAPDEYCFDWLSQEEPR